MTNQDFHSLRIQISNLLEEFGFREVWVEGSLGMQGPTGPADSLIGLPTYLQAPDMLTLDISIAAKLVPGEFHISTPEEQLHGK